MLVGWRELHTWGWRTAGRVREEPKGDPADDPTWESRRSRVQKDITLLAVRGRELHPNTESLVRGRTQYAQGCGREFTPGLSDSRAPVSNLGSLQVIYSLVGKRGAGHPASWEGSRRTAGL